MLNLHLLTDSKVLDPCRIQSHSPLTICLIAVGGSRSARRKPTLKSQSGTIPHIPVIIYWWNPRTYIVIIYQWNSSAHGRHCLSVCLRTQSGSYGVRTHAGTSQQVNGQTLYQLSYHYIGVILENIPSIETVLLK